MSGAHAGKLLRIAGQSQGWPLSLGRRTVCTACESTELPISPAPGHHVGSGSDVSGFSDSQEQDCCSVLEKLAPSRAAAPSAAPSLSNHQRIERWPVRHNTSGKRSSSSNSESSRGSSIDGTGSSSSKLVPDVAANVARVISPSWLMHSSSGKPTRYNRHSPPETSTALDPLPATHTTNKPGSHSPRLSASVAEAVQRWATRESLPSSHSPKYPSSASPLLPASLLQGLDSPAQLLQALPSLMHSLPQAPSSHAYWLAVSDLFHRAGELLSNSQVPPDQVHATMSRLCVLLLPARIAHTRLLAQQQHQHNSTKRAHPPVPPMDAVSILFSCGKLGHSPEPSTLEALIYSAISSSAPALDRAGASVSLGAARTWQARNLQGDASVTSASITALSQAPLQAAAHLCYALSRLEYTGHTAWDQLLGHVATHLRLLPDASFPQQTPSSMQPTDAIHINATHAEPNPGRSVFGADEISMSHEEQSAAPSTSTSGGGSSSSCAITSPRKPSDTHAHLAALAVALVHAKAFHHNFPSGSAPLPSAGAARPMASDQSQKASFSLRQSCIDLIAAKSCGQLPHTPPASFAKLCGALSLLKPADGIFWEAASVQALNLIEHFNPEQVAQLSEAMARVAKNRASVQDHSVSSSSSSITNTPAATALVSIPTSDALPTPLHSDSDPTTAVLLACQRQLVYAYRSQPGSVTQQQLVRVLLASASVGVVQPPLLDLAAAPLAVAFGNQPCSTNHLPQHMTSPPQPLDLPAMALIARAYTGKASTHAQLFAAMEGSFRIRIHAADVQEVVGVLRAFSSAKYASPALYQDTAYFMGCRAHDLPSATIADVAAALARARHSDAPFFRAACQQAMSRTGLLQEGLQPDAVDSNHVSSSSSDSSSISSNNNRGGNSNSGGGSSSSNGSSWRESSDGRSRAKRSNNSHTRLHTHLFATGSLDDQGTAATSLTLPPGDHTAEPAIATQAVRPTASSPFLAPTSQSHSHPQASNLQDSLRMSAKLLFPTTTTPQLPSPSPLSLSTPPPSEADYTIDPADLKSGSDTRTTVMIRNIPATLHPNRLLDLIDRHCRGLYDFFYLPHDPRSRGFSVKGNKGYAFLNLASPQAVGLLVEGMQGTTLVDRHIEKQVSINWSHMQGRAAMEGMFAQSTLRDQVAARIFNMKPNACNSSNSQASSSSSSSSGISSSREDTESNRGGVYTVQSGPMPTPASNSQKPPRPTSKTAFSNEQLASLAMSCAMVKTFAPGFFSNVATQLKRSFPLHEQKIFQTPEHLQNTALACLAVGGSGGLSLSVSGGNRSHPALYTSNSDVSAASALSGAGALKALWAFTTVNHPDTNLTQGLASKAAAAIMAAAEAGASTVFLLYSLAQAGVISQESKDKERELSRAVVAVLDSGSTSIAAQAHTGEGVGRSAIDGHVHSPSPALSAGSHTGLSEAGIKGMNTRHSSGVSQNPKTTALRQQQGGGVPVVARSVEVTASMQLALSAAAAAAAAPQQTGSSSSLEPVQSSTAVAPTPTLPFPNTTLLANTLKALAISGQISPALSSATAALLLTRSDAFSPLALSNVAWALAKQAHHPNRAVFDLLERSILANPTHHPLLHSPVALSNIVWSFARSGHRSASATLTPVISTAAAQLVPKLGPHQAVQLFWGFTAMQHEDRPLYHSLVKRLSHCYDIDEADLTLLQTTFQLHQRLFPAVAGISSVTQGRSRRGLRGGSSAGRSPQLDEHAAFTLPGFLNQLLSNAADAAGSSLPGLHAAPAAPDTAAAKKSNERWAGRHTKTPPLIPKDIHSGVPFQTQAHAGSASTDSVQQAGDKLGQERTQSSGGVSRDSKEQADFQIQKSTRVMELDHQGLHKLLRAVAAATAVHGTSGLAPEFVALLDGLQHSQAAAQYSQASG